MAQADPSAPVPRDHRPRVAKAKTLRTALRRGVRCLTDAILRNGFLPS
jgi:hypothetical protein